MSAAAIALLFAASSAANAQLYLPIGQLTGEIDPDMAATDIASAANATANGLAPDPWENLNRRFFGVHVFLDDNLLVPASRGYRVAVPKIGRRGLRKFLANARAPGIFINDILQGEFKRGGETAARFVINSVFGAGGFADPAAKLGIPQHSEDFGQTLAVWGVPSGPYTMFPVFGPGTVRSNFGNLGQIAMNPLIYVRTPSANIARNARAGMSALSAREPLIEPLEQIRGNSLDYYASFRSFYLQARKREIANGRTSFDDLPDITDFEDFDEFDEIGEEE
ncbi:MAG: VacJ family lipoprotein [Pseudomonadota bacterium]